MPQAHLLSSKSWLLLAFLVVSGFVLASCQQKEPIQFGTWDDPASRHLGETGTVFYADAIMAAYVPFGVGEINAKFVKFTIAKKGSKSTVSAWNEPVSANFSSLLIRFWDPTNLTKEEWLQPGEYTLSVYRGNDLLNAGNFTVVPAIEKSE